MNRSKHVQLFFLLLIGVLCLGVLLQILGVSISFWDLDGWYDSNNSLLLDGSAIVTSALSAHPLFSPMAISIASRPRHHERMCPPGVLGT